MLAGTAATLAFPGPGHYATPPPHLGIDFRSPDFASVAGQEYLTKADGFVFDSTGEFAWSRQFGIGVDSSPTDPREPRTEVFDFISGPSLKNTVITGVWLDDMTGPVAVSGAYGFGGVTPDRAGDAFLPLDNNFGGVITGVDGATFDIVGYTTERVKSTDPKNDPQKVHESGNLLMVIMAWKLEQRLAPIVVNMTNQGIGFNTDAVSEALADLEARLADAKHRALTWFGDPQLNLNSHVQLLSAFQAKGRTLSSTGEEALKADGSEGALLLPEYRSIRDKELKFLTGLSAATRPDGRIQAVFNSMGTKTGRFGCKDPNLQNIPKVGNGLFPIRSLFEAPPGKKLVIADFAQMELVAASVLAPEPKMLEAFKNGEDLHCRTASILLGRTVTKSDKANRSLAKAVNFGLLYGQSAAGLKIYAKNTYGVTMTDEEAVQFREAFFNEYQGLAAWHETARAAANDPDVTEVRTHRIGRRQHLADSEHWWQRFTALVNTPVQGSCAEVTKLGLLDIGTKLRGRAQLVSCVHDEIIVECDEADAAEVMAEVQGIMETRSAQIFNRQPIAVEAHIADNWAGVKVPKGTYGRYPKHRERHADRATFRLI